MTGALVGVDLGGTSLRAGRVEGGRVVAHAARPTPARAAAGEVVDAVISAIEEVLSPGTRAIGVGVPSVVDVESGVVYAVENIPSWTEVPLGALLEARFGLPVRLNNDASCFALGEHRFGKGRGVRSLVGMVVGTGLGTGLVLDGRLHCGANCGAGELGAVPTRGRTHEWFASGSRFLREHGVDGATLHARALAGDANALRAFEAFGRDLGEVVALALYAYDPEMVVLGGSVSRAYPLFEAGLLEALRSFAYQRSVARLRLEVSEEPHAALLGAAALGLEGETWTRSVLASRCDPMA